MPTTTTTPQPLTQLEVQEELTKLLRLATAWARRSFERDEPRDRREDEALLNKVCCLTRRHEDVPLITARGKTKVVLRTSTLADLQRYRTLLRAIVDAQETTPRSWRARLPSVIADAFTSLGDNCSVPRARRIVEQLPAKGPPTVLADKVLQAAGFRSYRSLKAAEQEEARTKEILRRREVTRLELIEYFLACLQVPEEDLHAIAAAVDSVCKGGTLVATPRRWGRRAAFGTAPKHPADRPKYVRYGAALLSDPSIGLLSDEYQPDDPDFE